VDRRLDALTKWLTAIFAARAFSVTTASEDASFRRYFRVQLGDASYVVMDAPPDKEDCRPFVAIAAGFAARGINVPQVIESDLRQGFLLLTDFGATHYLSVLDDGNVDGLYRDAIHALIDLQTPRSDDHLSLPPYDRDLLLREMGLFGEWYVSRHLAYKLNKNESDLLTQSFEILAQSALGQPRVWVHRDYHSRNLMVVPERNPGVLDFQDAVVGPVTYDLVSLLRDCYIRWAEDQVWAWAEQYRRLAIGRHLIPPEVGDRQFRRWFDLMGAQRHLKAIGIFARLKYRDGKDGFIGDIPRTLGYLVSVCARYDEISELHELLVRLSDLDSRPAHGPR
jgi:aminoglycoside/choline kinase family phosphotransferase